MMRRLWGSGAPASARPRRWAASALVVALAPVLASCGADDAGRPVSADDVTAAASALASPGTAPTSAPKPSVTIPTARSLPVLDDKESGVDLGAQLSRWVTAVPTGRFVQTTRGGGTTQKASGVFDVRGKGRSQVAVDGFAHLEMISVDGKIWIKGFPDSPKPWADMNGGQNLARLTAAMMGSARSFDPRLYSRMIARSTGRVTRIDRHDTQVDVTYSFTITAKEYGSAAGPLTEQLTSGTVTGPVGLDLTVDLHGKPIAVRTTSTVLGKRYVKELTYSAWGDPVQVAAPPAGQVGPPPSLGDD